MATPNRQVPGLAPPYFGGTAERGASLASLIGATGDAVRWPRVLAFFAAMTAADVVNFLIQAIRESSPGAAFFLRIFLTVLIGNVVVAAAALVAFRFIRQAVLASLVAATGYAVVMVPVRMATFGLFSSGSFTFSLEPRGLVVAFAGFLWQLLFLLGLALLVPRIRPLALALGVGAGAGQVLAGLVNPLVWKMVEPNVVFSFRAQLVDAVFALINAGVFALAFWGGLLLSGYREGMEEAAAVPRGGSVPTGRIGELTQGANFLMVRRLLRGAGIGSIVFGVIAIGLGAYSIQENPVNAILLLLGVLLLAEGIWIVTAPSPAGMVVDGVALLLLGLWNLFVSLANMSAGAGRPGAFVALGAFQIFWGIQSFRRYGRFANLPMKKPDEAMGKWLDGVLNSMAAGSKETPDRADFLALVGGKKDTWKGRLLEDVAFFMRGKDEEILIAGKQECSVTPLGTAATGAGAIARIQLGARTFDVTGPLQAIERFQSWKAGG